MIELIFYTLCNENDIYKSFDSESLTIAFQIPNDKILPYVTPRVDKLISLEKAINGQLNL